MGAFLMKKVLSIFFVVLILLIGSIAAFNYIKVIKPYDEIYESDPRNKGVEISVHYQNYINPKILVFSVDSIAPSNSMADVFRVLWSYAGKMKSEKFDKVELAYKGNVRFYVSGTHFQNIGMEYGIQNPVYVIRTFPENIYTKDGLRAFNVWTGGVIGVTGKQMEDFNELNKKWYLNDLLKKAD